ncbi:MAG TPA: hypothetical protein VNW29_01840 [Candidatus Sulfotelmatobacter sp.]|jgi:hypothetical protein|nr:hypothetical protein [Candidatus Sulfotelmatobacter sp.]
MNKKALLLASIVPTLYLSAAFPVFATSTPNFGSCLNPQWSQTQVNYGSNHGVVNTGSFSGTDIIYSSNGNVLQCLCTDQGNGYQTNWLNVTDYSSTQIDELKAQGWIYIPDGKEWGLNYGPYLALNSTYACTSCTPTPTPANTPTVTPGPTATPTPETKVGAASANNLANTGDSFFIYISLLAGAASLILGVVLRKLSK